MPFVGLAPLRLLRHDMAVLYHVNGKLQKGLLVPEVKSACEQATLKLLSPCIMIFSTSKHNLTDTMTYSNIVMGGEEIKFFEGAVFVASIHQMQPIVLYFVLWSATITQLVKQVVERLERAHLLSAVYLVVFSVQQGVHYVDIVDECVQNVLTSNARQV